jgi:hypothetical protein
MQVLTKEIITKHYNYSQMPEYQGNKFKEYLQKKLISTDKAREILGLKSRQTVYQYFASKNLNPETVDNILTKFNATAEEIFGEQKTSISRIETKPLRMVDPYGLEATGQKFYTLSDGSEVMQIPVVPVKAYGSYLRGHADPEFYDGFETLTIPVDKQHKGTYIAFEMGGESMVNIETKEMARKSLWPGQKIIGRDLKREHWKYKLHIHSNEAWIIVHQNEGVVVKEITDHNIDTGDITLHSWNPDKSEYADYTVNLEDVQQLFNVVDPFGKLKPY